MALILFIKYTTKYLLWSDNLIIENDNGRTSFDQRAELLTYNNKRITDVNKYLTIQNGPNPRLKSTYFDASNKIYLKIKDKFQTYNFGVSYTFWFKAVSNPTWTRFFDFGNGPNQDNIICYINSDYIGFGVWKNSNKSWSLFNVIPNVLDNKWHHIGWTLNSNKTWNIYLDGKLFNSYTNQNYPDPVDRSINYIGWSNWSNDSFYTGCITDFRIYNGVLSDTGVENIYYEGLGTSYFNISDSEKEFQKNDLLYSYIFTDLFDTNKNGYNECTNCSFGFDPTSNSSVDFPTVNGPDGCKDKCTANNKCTSYSFDKNKSKCFNYLNDFPYNIYNDVKNVDSAYKLNFPYDYTKLNDIQKKQVKKVISNEYLNYKFTPNKEIDYSYCNTITENDNKTTFNNNPECIYNLMKENNIYNNIESTFDYKLDAKSSIPDNDMNNYFRKFAKNLYNINERTVLAPRSNVGIHAPVDTESRIEPTITASDISQSIQDTTKPIIDTYSNQYLENNNQNKNYKILLIILLFIILGFFIYKLNK
jgi:hypothetical protein